VYEPHEPGDGARVLVDRLWPRGVKKEGLVLDRWMKEVAPSSGLRTWYAHEPERWAEFAKRYQAELRTGEQAIALKELRLLAKRGTLTLLTATKDVERSAAEVLRRALG
jgi:uncharacterized protein YeaO (DUF488 family)